MNNITSNKKPSLKTPIDIITTNCGMIQCNQTDITIIRVIDLLATLAWDRDNENTSGWEYFADIADSCGVDFVCLDPEDNEPV